MHRRTDLFGEDAAEFRPERWLDEGEKKGLRVGWEFLPFNGGPRICIGRMYPFPYQSVLQGRGRGLTRVRTICLDGSLVRNSAPHAGVLRPREP